MMSKINTTMWEGCKGVGQTHASDSLGFEGRDRVEDVLADHPFLRRWAVHIQTVEAEPPVGQQSAAGSDPPADNEETTERAK